MKGVHLLPPTVSLAASKCVHQASHMPLLHYVQPARRPATRTHCQGKHKNAAPAKAVHRALTRSLVASSIACAMSASCCLCTAVWAFLASAAKVCACCWAEPALLRSACSSCPWRTSWPFALFRVCRYTGEHCKAMPAAGLHILGALCTDMHRIYRGGCMVPLSAAGDPSKPSGHLCSSGLDCAGAQHLTALQHCQAHHGAADPLL